MRAPMPEWAGPLYNVADGTHGGASFHNKRDHRGRRQATLGVTRRLNGYWLPALRRHCVTQLRLPDG